LSRPPHPALSPTSWWRGVIFLLPGFRLTFAFSATTFHAMQKRIFLAGAAGAVGRRLSLLLVQEGWQVTGTTRSPEKAAVLRDMGVTPAVVDVYDEAKLRRAVADAAPEIVIHQLTDLPPGLDPQKMAEGVIRNTRIREVGTRHLLAAAVNAGARRIVAQSIAFAFAPGPTP